jgi:hypothetical protein
MVNVTAARQNYPLVTPTENGKQTTVKEDSFSRVGHRREREKSNFKTFFLQKISFLFRSHEFRKNKLLSGTLW